MFRAYTQQYSQMFPHTSLKIRDTRDTLPCWGWWSEIWHCVHILLKGQFQAAATHYQHIFPLQAHLWTMYTHFTLPLSNSCCSIRSIFFSFLNTFNLWLPAHTESPYFRHYTFRCRHGLSDSAPANIGIYAWWVCEGHCYNGITVMLGVNPSVGRRCPPHTHCRCTAQGDKYPHLTGFWVKSMLGPIHFQDPIIASIVQAPQLSCSMRKWTSEDSLCSATQQMSGKTC